LFTLISVAVAFLVLMHSWPGYSTAIVAMLEDNSEVSRMYAKVVQGLSPRPQLTEPGQRSILVVDGHSINRLHTLNKSRHHLEDPSFDMACPGES
jgi:hypothetical protein